MKRVVHPEETEIERLESGRRERERERDWSQVEEKERERGREADTSSGAT